MTDDTATTRTPTARRHPLQVTAARIRDAIKEYPQIFDGPSRAVAEVLARRFEDSIETGALDGKPAFGPPENPGAPVDQRVKR